MGLENIRHSARIGLTALIVAVGIPASAAAETLADAMASAYDHRGLLQQNRALLRAADEDVAVAISGLRPIVNWTANATRTAQRFRSNTTTGGLIDSTSATTASVGLSLDLVLYDAGRTRMGVDAAKEAVLATRQALLGVEQNIFLQVVQAYMDVRSATEIVALRRNNVRVLTEELRAAKDRFEVGEVTRTDVAQSEARLAASRSALVQAEGDLAVAREFYAFAVGHRPNRLAPPAPTPSSARSLQDAKAIAMRNHPEMLRVKHAVAAADINAGIAKAQEAPKISLTSRIGLQDTVGNNNFSESASVGIEMSGPIYQGGKISALQRQAIARRDAERANLHEVRANIAQNVGNAFAQIQVARAARDASQRQIRAAQVAFRGVREEATLGARTTLDVLNAEQELLDAKAGLITATSNETVASYSLLASMGLLTAEHLNLNVKQYDPAAYYNMVKTAPTRMSKQGQKLDRVLRALGKQ
ncbi:TolC family outer membrane protein [Sediminimonas qiaohouensis]|uniref:TolC family outer membrane protein n=1 Tax=Sediminimonas qiaohouensis TaxID=552061 RepID=UPI0004257B13|nr:TolC family outer membrane protein [Sediminimonas qiaohouensis]